MLRRRRHHRTLSIVVSILLAAGCRDEGGTSVPNSSDARPSGDGPATSQHSPPSSKLGAASNAESIFFVEAAESSGVNFTYRNGEESGHYAILESLGGGVALLDYDLDGTLDLFFPGGGAITDDRKVTGRDSALFRRGQNRAYRDVAPVAFSQRQMFYSHGAAVSDFNQDGFPDLLVTGYGGVSLYVNSGDGTFDEVAKSAGLNDALWSSSAAFADFNGDHLDDLYIAHYVNWSFDNDPACFEPQTERRDVCPPKRFDPLPDAVYMNRGDGTFLDDTQRAGLNPEGKGLGVAAADVDSDGDMDVYVANDTVDNFLYLNDGSGHFAESGLLSGAAFSDRGTPDGSMGVAVGDFDLDARFDIWVTNYESESSALYRNEGNGLFHHVSRSAGVMATGSDYVGWGVLFFDADRDGDEDVVVSNGHVIRHPRRAPLKQLPLLFENLAGRTFTNVARRAGDYFADSHHGRGVAAGDLDRDGDLDLVISRVNSPAALLWNESPNDRHWVAVRPIGTVSPRSGVGAKIEVRTPEKSQWRQVIGGGSYASSSPPTQFFGLGNERQILEIRIAWPSGTVQIIQPAAVDRVVDAVEPPAEPSK